MPILLPLLLLFAAKDPVTYGRTFGGQALPTFDQGYLLFAIRPNTVEVWDPQGQLQFRVTVDACNSISSLAMGGDGIIAVNCGHTATDGIKRGGIALLDRNGKRTGFFDTGRYVPSHVAFDGKGDLWTFGWQRDTAFNDGEDKEDYQMFRKWTRTGKPLAALVERSRFPRPGLPPGAPQGGLWRLRVSNGWVGALAYSGKVQTDDWWVQFREDGSELSVSNIGPGSDFGVAFSGKLGLFRAHRSSIERFDLAEGKWKAAGNPVDDRGERPGLLLGANDDALVFAASGGNIRLTYWQPAPIAQP